MKSIILSIFILIVCSCTITKQSQLETITPTIDSKVINKTKKTIQIQYELTYQKRIENVWDNQNFIVLHNEKPLKYKIIQSHEDLATFEESVTQESYFLCPVTIERKQEKTVRKAGITIEVESKKPITFKYRLNPKMELINKIENY